MRCIHPQVNLLEKITKAQCFFSLFLLTMLCSSSIIYELQCLENKDAALFSRKYGFQKLSSFSRVISSKCVEGCVIGGWKKVAKWIEVSLFTFPRSQIFTPNGRESNWRFWRVFGCIRKESEIAWQRNFGISKQKAFFNFCTEMTASEVEKKAVDLGKLEEDDEFEEFPTKGNQF